MTLYPEHESPDTFIDTGLSELLQQVKTDRLFIK